MGGKREQQKLLFNRKENLTIVEIKFSNTKYQ